MRKVLVIACAVLMLVPVVVLAGCGGGDTGQARDYLQQAEQLSEKRGAGNTELLNAWRTVREAEDPAAKQEAWEEAERVYGEVEALLQEEKAEYEKITGLEGAGDYAEYAELKIKELNAFEQILTATNDFLRKLNNDEFASKEELDAASQEYQAVLEKLQAEYTRVSEEAERFRNDNNL